MPTLYHAPHSRSSRVISQLIAMGKLDDVDVVLVEVMRADGTGRRDPKNAHPEGKVPFLITDTGEEIRESSAIMFYLDEFFGHPLGVAPGQAGRGDLLSWMAVYGGVIEPILVAKMLEIDHKGIEKAFGTFEAMIAQLLHKLGDNPFLLGDQLTIADLIMASPFQFAPHFMPDVPDFKAWVARVTAATDTEALSAFEAKSIQKLTPSA